jgi:predicted transcriptional regulator
MNKIVHEVDRSVISVHTKPETSKRLAELAAITRRSKSFLANSAIERYLQEEEAFVASVKRGQADSAAGRVHTTEAVRQQLQDVIAKSADYT